MNSHQSHRFIRVAIAVFSLIAGMAANASAQSIRVSKSIAFSEESGASQKVKDECQLQTKVTAFLAEYASDVQLIDGPLGKKGRTLDLKVTSVHAPGGGAFSGPKTLTVTGTLRENGAKIGNFVATRYSTGGAFSSFKGTCAIIGRCAKAIAKDISVWLREPAKDSRLGDA